MADIIIRVETSDTAEAKSGQLLELAVRSKGFLVELLKEAGIIVREVDVSVEGAQP